MVWFSVSQWYSEFKHTFRIPSPVGPIIFMSSVLSLPPAWILTRVDSTTRNNQTFFEMELCSEFTKTHTFGFSSCRMTVSADATVGLRCLVSVVGDSITWAGIAGSPVCVLVAVAVSSLGFCSLSSCWGSVVGGVDVVFREDPGNVNDPVPVIGRGLRMVNNCVTFAGRVFSSTLLSASFFSEAVGSQRMMFSLVRRRSKVVSVIAASINWSNQNIASTLKWMNNKVKNRWEYIQRETQRTRREQHKTNAQKQPREQTIPKTAPNKHNEWIFHTH